MSQRTARFNRNRPFSPRDHPVRRELWAACRELNDTAVFRVRQWLFDVVAVGAGYPDFDGAVENNVVTMTVEKAIMYEVRRSGMNVSTHSYFDLSDGVLYHHVDASDPQAGKKWSVNAPDAYTTAYELEVNLGWEFD